MIFRSLAAYYFLICCQFGCDKNTGLSEITKNLRLLSRKYILVQFFCSKCFTFWHLSSKIQILAKILTFLTKKFYFMVDMFYSKDWAATQNKLLGGAENFERPKKLFLSLYKFFWHTRSYVITLVIFQKIFSSPFWARKHVWNFKNWFSQRLGGEINSNFKSLGTVACT